MLGQGDKETRRGGDKEKGRQGAPPSPLLSRPPAPPPPLVPGLEATWLQTRLQPLLITAVVTALVLGPVSVVRVVVPAGEWRYLPLVALLVALESVITTRWLAHTERRLSKVAYRAAELAVIALVLRLLTWTVAGPLPTLAGLRLYLLRPLAFFDGFFVIYTLAAVLAWERAAQLSHLFQQLALSPSEIVQFTLPDAERLRLGLDRNFPVNRGQLMQSYFQQWIAGGLVLGFCAALTTFELSNLSLGTDGSLNLRTIGRLGLRPELLLALLVYFMGGLWLASQGRLASLQARWLADGTLPGPDVGRTWHRTSLALLLAVAFIAAFLPIGSTFAIARLIELLALVIVLFAGLLLTLISFLFYSLLSLLGRPRPAPSPPPPDLEGLFPLVEPATPASQAASLILGSFFWLVIVVVTVLALLFFLRGWGVEVTAGRLRLGWRQLLAWLEEWWLAFSGRVESLGAAVRARWPARERPDGEGASPWRFLRLKALSPREQVRYFYLAAVRRAGQQGVARKLSETPLEYAANLQQEWPEAETEVAELTGAFLKARYSTRPVGREEVSPARRAWQRIKTAMRTNYRESRE
ncbi:MAG: DUF4129 domain-containing protein [Chloroflexi bacterium]|nr:DUF4129 domain-containing protein [Chloroflexota bacterium]MCI0646390.1 DUF4129 domain-containing protein [Chloroflexota bacterium]MCI0728352.1 DUF4129 domain-containing protein [Chloroflexota bacterium]